MTNIFFTNKLKILGNKRFSLQAFVAALLILIISFSIMASTSTVAAITSAGTSAPGNPSTYGSLSQYTWPEPRGNPSNTGFSPGPAPNAPDIAWATPISGISGMTAVFNGLVFAESGTALIAVNAATGVQVWSAVMNSTAGVSRIGPTQIDNNYLIVYNGHQIDCFSIATGAFVWQTSSLYTGANNTLNPGGPAGGLLPGGPDYMAGIYSPDTKMDYIMGYNGITEVIYAYDLSNPATTPPVAWTYTSTNGGNESFALATAKSSSVATPIESTP